MAFVICTYQSMETVRRWEINVWAICCFKSR